MQHDESSAFAKVFKLGILHRADSEYREVKFWERRTLQQSAI